VVICTGVATEPGSADLDGRKWQYLMLMLRGGSKGKSLKRYLDSSLTQDLASSVSSQFSGPVRLAVKAADADANADLL
jgi:macrodomain Ter protein organizer (MatP/YcbG family)